MLSRMYGRWFDARGWKWEVTDALQGDSAGLKSVTFRVEGENAYGFSKAYERGVEGETLACGTGVTASALIASRVHGFTSPVKVQVQGGDLLEVSWREQDGAFGDVQLTGPADFVFTGRIEL